MNMKRSRVDEVQFGARGGPHRILTTQHNPVSSIQYMASSNSLKTTGVVADASAMGGGSTPTVQYTTYYQSSYNTTLTAGGAMKPNQQQTPSAAQPVGNPNATPMHIINTGNVSAGNSIRHAKTSASIQASGGPPLGQQSSNNPITSNIATVAPTTTVQQPPQQQPPPPQQQQQPPPLQQQQQPGGGPTVAGQEKFQRLKVEDALSYLDQVKYKFGNQPQVYNDFLDIMKEFKSQSIDTPGVIQRVSNLFKGHPELIVGFNTFLPPGYKIEVQANDQGVAFQVSVSVPSPSGNSSIQITQQPTSPPHKGPTQYVHTLPQSVNLITSSSGSSVGGGPLSSSGAGGPPQQQQPQNLHLPIQSAQPSPHLLGGGAQSQPQNFARERTISTGTTVTTSGGISVAMVNPMANNNTNNHSTSSNPSQSPLRSAGQPALSNHSDVLNNSLHHISQAHQSILHAEQTGTTQQPVEFNNAISYVNKIKNRFAMQPEKYKRFLEILHAYQKEQKNLRDGNGTVTKTLSEAEVYSQVAKLFDQQDDLLREFGQFLPDATSPSGFYTAPPAQATHNMIGSGLGGMQQHHHQQQQQQLQQQPTDYPKKVVIPQPSPQNSLKYTIQAAIAGIPPPNRLHDHDHHHPQPPTLLSVVEKNVEFHPMGPSSGGPQPPSHPHPPGRPSSDKDRNHIINSKFNAQQITALQQQNTSVKRSPSYNNTMAQHGHQNTRSGSTVTPIDGPLPPKRHKPICRDITLAEASKYGSLSDYAFFDKARKAVRNPDVYENFLRCLTLYNQEILSKSELLATVTPFLRKFPELLRWFQDFLVLSPGTMPGPQVQSESISLVTSQRPDHRLGQTAGSIGGLSGPASAANDNNTQEIDLSACKRLGASYCALPNLKDTRKCSGRTALCKEVLNDQWASFPTWAEESTFVTSRKTHYEEIIYRCEDERFELDVVIETNSATIRVLEGVSKRMSRMGPEEMARFRLDDNLGGNSPTIHQRALRRIYGDKAAEVIQGLKKNPAVAVPVVLKRLKSKEEEWREAQKGFNKQWRDQNEKYYLKSLDHQGINFKQNDIKALRSKSLFNEIETLFDERHDQHVEPGLEAVIGPHIVVSFKDKTILEDAANLLIHHVKRQTGIQKQEKTKIKNILRQFVPDLFFSPRQQLSDDERDDDDIKDIDVDQSDSDTNRKPSTNRSCSSGSGTTTTSIDIKNDSILTPPTTSSSSSSSASSNVPSTASGSSTTINATLASALPGAVGSAAAENATDDLEIKNETSELYRTDDSDVHMTDANEMKPNASTKIEVKEDVKDEMDCDSPTIKPAHAISKHTEEAYSLFFGNNNWYLFLRLHAVLCDRLRTMCDRAQVLVAEEAAHRCNRRESTATALRLKPKSEVAVEDYYPTFLDMLKNVLDGNMDGIGYEDALREMFGIHAYVAFTLDRVVTNAVRQLQNCVTERGAVECVELFHAEQRKNGAGGLCRTATKRMAAEMAYQRRAEASLLDENCFKVYIYKIDCRLTIELLDTEPDEARKASGIANQAKWSSYVDQMANPAAGPSSQLPTATGSANHRRGSNNSSTPEHGGEPKTDTTDIEMQMATMRRRPIFLNRNIRRFKKRYANLMVATPPSSSSRPSTDTADAQTATSTAAPSNGGSSVSILSTISESTNVRISAESLSSVATIAPAAGGQPHLTTFTQLQQQQQLDHSSSSTSVTTTTSSTISTDGGAAATATTTTTSASSSSNTTSSTSSSTTISLSTVSSTDASSTAIVSSAGTTAPANPIAVAEWASLRSPPERIGSTAGVRDGYLIDDCAEIKLNMTSYRMEFVLHKDVIFYKRKSLLRSRQTHPAVTKSMSDKFYKFANAWCEANVTQPLSHRCYEWFMGREDDLVANTTSQLQSTDTTRTPYRVYNRYRTIRTPAAAAAALMTSSASAGGTAAPIHGSHPQQPSAAVISNNNTSSLSVLSTNHLNTIASVAAAGRDS